MPGYMSNLATLLFDRYNEYGDSADIEEAIDLGRKAFGLTNTDPNLRSITAANLSRYLEAYYVMNRDPDRGNHLEIFSRLLLRRFDHTQNITDMDKAIRLVEEAVVAPTYDGESVEGRWAIFSNLVSGLAKAFTFESTLNPSHVDHHAYAVSEEYVLMVSKKDTLLLAQEDVERSIFFAQAALSATPKTHYLYRTYLQTWASILRTEYQRFKNLSTLAKAIEVIEEALTLTTPFHPRRGTYVTDLSILYFWNHEESQDLESFESLERALELGNEAETKHELSKNIADLDMAIRFIRKSLERIDERDWEYSGFLRNLANKYYRRYAITYSQEDYQASIDTYVRASEAKYSPPRSLVLAARNAAIMQAEEGDFLGASASLSRALDQLPKLRPRYFKREDKQDVLAEHHSLACDAAAFVLAAGKTLYKALGMLELGNAVIIGSIIDYRNNVSELQEKQPQLYNEFNRLRGELDFTTPSMEQVLGNDSILTRKTRTLRQKRKIAAKRMNEVLSEIRKVKSFEDFLLVPSYDKLLRLARDDPIVVLNHSIIARRLDTLIVTSDGIKHLPLSSTFSIGMPPAGSFILERDIYSGLLRTRSIRNENLRSILKIYWNWTIEPICTKLGLIHREDPSQLPYL
ncbi:uncharacterized protein N7458_007723 [Penicillium daleae]|uniref:CHAT domain-containing protein n=1 Tax=Penicillium daleae TaxID=63821 RepID=A0AAD6C1L5_9EURO|nr:uncharacterized protein N7458_007723 [Penicillium daleae]KAJ5443851.1 hypothetical protein N7458_007723 [Penicillium daleae]